MTDYQPALGARREPLDPYAARPLQLLGVVDTNVLLSSIDNDCRKGYRSRLLRMSDNGAVVLYAADHVYDEMYERLPRFAQSSPVPLASLVEHFEEAYLPALRFVTVSDVDTPDPQVLAITDPDDIPTGRLAMLIAPCVVFSEDKHLTRPGLAPERWRDVAKSAVDIGEGVRDQTNMINVAALPVQGIAGLVTLTGRRFGISPWVIGGAALGAGMFLLKKPERRKAAGQVASRIIATAGELFETARAREEQGIASLREVILDDPSWPTHRQMIALTLARQGAPLLARDAYGLIREHFLEASPWSLREVRVELEEGTEFVRAGHRWQLGRERAPRTSPCLALGTPASAPHGSP